MKPRIRRVEGYWLVCIDGVVCFGSAGLPQAFTLAVTLGRDYAAGDAGLMQHIAWVKAR